MFIRLKALAGLASRVWTVRVPSLIAICIISMMGAAVAWACTPTLMTVADLVYNLQAEPQEAVAIRLYATRDAASPYGQYVTGLRKVCVVSVMGVPAACPPSDHPRPMAQAPRRTPGPGPGPCYVTVVDWGQEPSGADLTVDHCAALDAQLGLVVE